MEDDEPRGRKRGRSPSPNAIRSVYEDPSVGLLSQRKMQRRLAERPDLRPRGYGDAKLKSFVSSRPGVLLSKKPPKPLRYASIIVDRPGSNYQMDVLVMGDKRYRDYGYVYVVVDVYSRYAAARALRSHKPANTLSAFEDIVKREFSLWGEPKTINCDQEFDVKTWKDYAHEHGIRMYVSETGESHKNAIVERFNRTLRTYIQRYKDESGNPDWVSVLPKLMRNYNTLYHDTIRNPPDTVWKGEKPNLQVIRFVGRSVNPGDKVRLSLHRTESPFRKGEDARVSRLVYTVSDRRKPGTHNQFALVDDEGRTLLNKKGKPEFFKDRELVRVGGAATPAPRSGTVDEEERVNRFERRLRREDLGPVERNERNEVRILPPLGGERGEEEEEDEDRLQDNRRRSRRTPKGPKHRLIEE